MCVLFCDDERDKHRSLNQLDKERLWERAKHKCEICGAEVNFIYMEVGHNRAWSKGGSTTLKNSLCLCHNCNHLQGTETKKGLLKKLGIEDKEDIMKNRLESLSIAQLKDLAKKKGISVKGTVEEGLFGSSAKAPTKKKYISKLKGVVSEEEINALPNEAPKVKKKKRRKQSDGLFGF